MGWCRFAVVALAAQLFERVYGYGTTVEVFVSYCPATYMSTTLGGSGASSTYASTSATSGVPSGPSSTPYVLAINDGLGGPSQYVADDGTLTTNESLAVVFTINPSGQLMGAGGYISASGDSDTQRFAVNSTLGSVSTLFSIVSNDTLGRRDGSSGGGILLWQNETFVDGQAIFCTFGSILQACFNGQAPAGCEVVTLGAVPASDFSSSSSNSASTNSILSSEMTSTTSDPTSGYASAPNGPTTTPNGPSSGKSLTTTPSLGTLGTTTSMSIGTNPVYGSSTSAGQSASSSISSTASVYPTSTGAPSCDDRSSYDGTVNDNYLILCDTDLPGFDIGSVPASDLADCIGVCNAYTPSSEGKCVAVTFNSSTATDPCTLKSNINTVNRGADAFAQAAIVVNEPYAPTIVFANSGTSSSSSTVASGTAGMFSSTSITSSQSTLLGTSSSLVPTTTSASTGTSKAVSSGLPTQQRSSTSTTTPQLSQTVGSSTTALNSGLSSSTSVTSTPGTTSQPSSTTSTSGVASTSLSSLPSSSSVSTTPITSPTTSLAASSSLTTSQSSSPAVTTSTQTTISTVVPSSSTRSTTLTSATTTTTTPSYCSATPTTLNLCPTYNHQALNVNGDGACYEVECSTQLQGTMLAGNSTLVTSLKTCIATCNIYNGAIPYGCVGVSYYGASSGSSPNCILFSSVTGTDSASGIDSGRLMYQGYSSISDVSYAPITTTTSSTTTTTTIAVTTTTTRVSTTSGSAGVVTSGSTTTTTTTTSASVVFSSGTTSTTTTLSCAPAPTASSCPGNSPYCYAYTKYGNTDNFEVECATSFSGAALQPVLAFSFEDCVGWCQYANEQGIDVPGSVCVGFTFQESPVAVQGGPNNCFRYSSLTCATRGNATFDSGRLLFSGYPAMTDYAGNGFSC